MVDFFFRFRNSNKKNLSNGAVRIFYGRYFFTGPEMNSFWALLGPGTRAGVLCARACAGACFYGMAIVRVYVSTVCRVLFVVCLVKWTVRMRTRIQT